MLILFFFCHGQTLQILRAIGNMGHSERLAFSLEKCFNNKNNPAEVRVASLDAFRRLPCSTDVRIQILYIVIFGFNPTRIG